MDNSVTIVVFGGTGDLMRRKLVPSFLRLWKDGTLNENCLIVGVGRRPFDDKAYSAFLYENLNDEERSALEKISIKYFTGDITNREGMTGLHAFLARHEKKECMGRFFYLATGYIFFPTIVSALQKEQLHELRCGWTRVAFEKPFGQNLASAGTLESGVHKVFTDDSIYRIDHYMVKDGARLLLSAKESCSALRKILSCAYVSQIEIIAEETIGVGERIAYYNESGALKDMVQSHLLQLAALVIGEPATWSAEAVHRAKLRVLKSLSPAQAEKQIFGQYQSYASEAGKYHLSGSTTETYARVVLQSSLPSWNGVPIILRTGKNMPEKKTVIRIKFRVNSGQSADLSIFLHPLPKINFTSEGTVSQALQSVADEINVLMRNWQPPIESDDGYSFLLERVIAGDQRWFVKQKEIEACWLLIEEIERQRQIIPLLIYPNGTNPETLKAKV